jgi:hypothetical protein
MSHQTTLLLAPDGTISECEWDRMWKEGVVAKYEILHQQSSGWTEENPHKTSDTTVGLRA